MRDTGRITKLTDRRVAVMSVLVSLSFFVAACGGAPRITVSPAWARRRPPPGRALMARRARVVGANRLLPGEVAAGPSGGGVSGSFR